MRDIFATQLAPTVGAACPVPAEASDRASLIATQMLGRYVLELAPLTAMPPDELVGWSGPTVQRYLTAR